MDNIDMQKLAGQIKQLDEVLKQITVVQHSRRGLLKILLNGRQDVLMLRIDPQLSHSVSSTQMAQELKTIFNEALKLFKEHARREMIRITGVDVSVWGDFF